MQDVVIAKCVVLWDSVIKCSPKKEEKRVLNGKCKLDERKFQFKFQASEKIALFDIRRELPGS